MGTREGARDGRGEGGLGFGRATMDDGRRTDREQDMHFRLRGVEMREKVIEQRSGTNAFGGKAIDQRLSDRFKKGRKREGERERGREGGKGLPQI
jgi:hypothetical protein